MPTPSQGVHPNTTSCYLPTMTVHHGNIGDAKLDLQVQWPETKKKKAMSEFSATASANMIAKKERNSS
ncbi:hypothetical protein V6N11_018305 [Hibiscus sabdariffa]|uniref:Uncharacterized protein n=1 Tax=Hibiscus sabdariffa TaxID=183260 RepID=A0ABR2T7D7_9ROSI